MIQLRTNKVLLKNLGLVARKCRKAHRAKAQDVANDIGISRGMLYLFEGGKCSGHISMNILYYYVKNFGLDVTMVLRDYQE